MKAKKRLAAEILKTSRRKVRFAAEALDDIKKAITRSDIRGLVAVGRIWKEKKNAHSRSCARRIAEQRKKGRRRGTKKGGKNAIVSKKEKWMAKIRVQRKFIKTLKDKELLLKKDYRNLYSKTKGGYFRNKRHIKLYLGEQRLIQKEKHGK